MTPEELEGMNGRRALVEGVIETTNSPDAVGVVDHDGLVRVRFAHRAGGYLSGVAWLLPSAIREILPEPIKVGDRVEYIIDHSTFLATILIIDGDVAGVRYDDGDYGWQKLSQLTLVETGAANG